MFRRSGGIDFVHNPLGNQGPDLSTSLPVRRNLNSPTRWDPCSRRMDPLLLIRGCVATRSLRVVYGSAAVARTNPGCVARPVTVHPSSDPHKQWRALSTSPPSRTSTEAAAATARTEWQRLIQARRAAHVTAPSSQPADLGKEASISAAQDDDGKPYKFPLDQGKLSFTR